MARSSVDGQSVLVGARPMWLCSAVENRILHGINSVEVLGGGKYVTGPTRGMIYVG